MAITCQNSRSTPDDASAAPGDFIAERPVNSVIQHAGLPINTSTIKVLRTPLESTQFRSHAYLRAASRPAARIDGPGRSLRRQRREGILLRAAAKECPQPQALDTREELRLAIVVWIEKTYHR